MRSLKCIIYICLYVFVLQFFYILLPASAFSDDEFSSLTGSELKDVYCSKLQLEKNPQEWWKTVESIKLELNYKKFTNDVLDKLRNFRGVSSNKSKYRKVRIKLSGSKCWMSGKYRLTGDFEDHIGKFGKIHHSIKIKITDGKIDNILKFKLLTPKSRFGKKEVLNTLIHQKLGLLAPRTALVNVIIGGHTTRAIFQEDITKQLLENNNLHEAMLFEGDEEYLPFNIPKIINRSFATNPQFRDISRHVLEQLGYGYQFTSIMNKEKSSDLPIFLNFLPEGSLVDFTYFHLLNLSFNSLGGLTLDDSRFVFDHISRLYHPIYYDGHSGEKITKLSDINFDIPKDIRRRLLKDLEMFDLSELQLELNNLGAYFTIQELQKIFSDAIGFIQNTKNEVISHKLDEKLINLNFHGFIDNKAFKKIHDANLSSLQISWLLDTNKLNRCVYRTNSKLCVQEILDDNKKLILQTGRQSFSSGIFLHGLSYESLTPAYFQELISNSFTLSKTGTIIEHTNNLELLVNDDTKTVTVSSKNKNVLTSQIKVSGGTLDGWEFIVKKDVFLGYEKNIGSRASKFGLTGCITFNDLIIKSLKVYIQDAVCEDAIHFVRVKGNVESITVDQASADAVDADFSHIIFNNVSIYDAANDCIDFSAGTYRIDINYFYNCGDKGVSAGENSNVFLRNIEINNATIGIASKDGSKVFVKDASLFNVDVCLAVYKKKQEYGGSFLDIKKISCPSNDYFIQKGSSLFLPN